MLWLKKYTYYYIFSSILFWMTWKVENSCGGWMGGCKQYMFEMYGLKWGFNFFTIFQL